MRAARLAVLADDVALVADDDGGVPQGVAVHLIPLLSHLAQPPRSTLREHVTRSRAVGCTAQPIKQLAGPPPCVPPSRHSEACVVSTISPTCGGAAQPAWLAHTRHDRYATAPAVRGSARRARARAGPAAGMRGGAAGAHEDGADDDHVVALCERLQHERGRTALHRLGKLAPAPLPRAEPASGPRPTLTPYPNLEPAGSPLPRLTQNPAQSPARRRRGGDPHCCSCMPARPTARCRRTRPSRRRAARAAGDPRRCSCKPAAAGARPDISSSAAHTQAWHRARGRPRAAREGRARKGHRPCLLQAQHVHAHLAGGTYYSAHAVHQRLRRATIFEVPEAERARRASAGSDPRQAIGRATAHTRRALMTRAALHTLAQQPAPADASTLAHAGSAERSCSGAAQQRRTAHPRLFRKWRGCGRHYRVLHQADLDLAALPQLLRGGSEAVRLCPRPGPCQLCQITRSRYADQ